MKEKLSVTVDKDVLDWIKNLQKKSYVLQGMNWSQLVEYVLRAGIETLDKKKDLSIDV